MDYISSKNIFLLTMDTLGLIDRRLMEHGAKTGYVLYKMLEFEGKLEKFEIAEYVMLASIHDIGAYKTEDLDNFLHFDVKEVLPHSIYGYLFLKHLSPLYENAQIILYHGIDYAHRKDYEISQPEICDYLCLAETIAIYQSTMGEKFDYSALEQYADKRFSRDSYELFMKAQEKYGILEHLHADDISDELDEIMDYIMFTNEQKMQAMEMLMYSLAFRSKYKVIDSVTTVCLCKEFGRFMGLSDEENKKLFYAAIVHDIGMLGIPREMIDSTRKFTDEEREFVKKHVGIAEELLKGRLDESIIEIAMAHHERLNGSGYPRGLKDREMTISQKILQLADTLTAMINGRLHRLPMDKDEIIRTLSAERENKTFSHKMLDFVIDNYDSLTQKVNIETNQFLRLHNTINSKYRHVYENYSKMNL